jgi:lysyl-tRNA synthetase class II
MVEHYAVYWNYEDNMNFAEKMVKTLFQKLGLPPIINIEDKE